jgi:hypothetical protein
VTHAALDSFAAAFEKPITLVMRQAPTWTREQQTFLPTRPLRDHGGSGDDEWKSSQDTEGDQAVSSRGFPFDPTSCLGQFWLPTDPAQQRTGVVRVEGAKVQLDVSPALTSNFVFTPVSNGVTSISRPQDPTDMVVLGSVSESPSLLSLWGVRTMKRHSIGMPIPGRKQPESHSLVAEWCILGSQFPDPDMRFHGVRADFGNLTEWARLSGLTWSYVEGSKQMRWSYEDPDHLDAQLANDEGYLTLGSQVSFTLPDLYGSRQSTAAALELELNEGWTLSDCFQRFAIPFATLMTLLSGESCDLRTLSVWCEQNNKWHAIHGRHVEPESPLKCGELLLDRKDTGLDFMTRWLAVCEKISPVPHILAAVIAGEMPTVEAEALALVTAMEALHRTLDPGARRFTQADVDAAMAGLASAAIPSEIQKSLASALATWWPEYSYPMRVLALAEPVAAAVPECVGRLNRWKKAVVDQRVSLAHGIESGGMSIDDLTRMHALNLSIRWSLLIRLLVLAGVQPQALSTATKRSDRFRQESLAWRTHWPRLFESD